MAMDIGTLVGYLEMDTSGFEEAAEKVGKGMPTWMVAAGAAAGLALAAALAGSFVAAANIEAGNDKIAGQLGLTEEEGRRAGEAAAGAYGNAFGGSLEEVQAATAGVISSIGGMRTASVDSIQAITEKVLTLSDGFEVEADRISQVVGQMLSTGLVSSAEEGLDLLTVAMQKVPAAVREDIIDAVDEYGPFFASIGMSGEEAMGALVAASEKGMYGIDKTGDAVKEFSIRATDMSATSVAAYEAAGLSAEEMSAKILAGGTEAEEGFDQIVQGLLGIEDPVERANAAIGLFGTPLEDIGVNEIPKFLEGLTTMQGGLGDTAGAADAMAATLAGNPTTTWESITRNVELLYASMGEKLLPIIGPVLDAVLAGFQSLSPVMDVFSTAIAAVVSNGDIMIPVLSGLAAGLLYALAPAIWAAVTAVWSFTTALLANPLTWIVIAIAAVVAAIVALAMNWDEVVAWVTDVWAGFVSWLTEVTEGLATWWNDLWEGVGQWITDTWEGFVGWIEDTWAAFDLWLRAAGAAFGAWWNRTWTAIGDTISAIWDGFVSFVRLLWESSLLGMIVNGLTYLFDNWDAIWNAVGTVIRTVWAGFVSWIQGVWNGFVGFIQSGLSAFSGFWTGLWNGIMSAARGAWDGFMGFVRGIPGAILSAFNGAATWLVSIGRDILRGLWDGLKSIWSNISRWFEDTVGGIIDTFTGLLGIHSPSRVFREFGINIGEGLIEGLDRIHPEVDVAMRSMALVPETAGEFLARYPVDAGRSETNFTYVAAENQSLSSEEALYAALGAPRSPFGGEYL